jgi:hypothetical protein
VEKPQITTQLTLRMNSKQCTKCGEFKDLDEFYTNDKMPDGRFNSCKKCYGEERRKHYHNKPANICLANMKTRTKQRNFEDVEWSVEEIEQKMSGCCEVTGIPFESKRSTREQHMGRPYVASPDRIDNSKGYTKENTRWVVWIFNLMCGNFTDEQVKHFIEHLRNNEINL